MNTVNLIGSIVAPPKVFERNGRQNAQITLRTKEPYLDKYGDQHFLQNSHAVIGWGKWFKVIEQYAQPGLQVCIQGSLRTNYYQDKLGKKHCRTEIEVQDFLLM